MTVRELLDTCALDFNKIDIHRKGMIIFADNPEKMTEIMKGLKVKRWEQYKSEWDMSTSTTLKYMRSKNHEVEEFAKRMYEHC